ncbi:MAG: alpha/beta hydrolase, partial [Sphingobacteriales bacterium]
TFTCPVVAQHTDYSKLGDNKAAGKFIDIRGFKMYYESYGQGEPILMIHGNGGSVRAFNNQVPYFAKNYRVIIADSRAQGKSIDTHDSLTYEMMADDLAELIDKLHLKQVNIIGWSDGGINGLLLASRHPDKVKKLAVTGANLWPDTTAVDPFIVNFVLHQADSLSKIEKTPDVKFQLKMLDLVIYQPHIKLEQLKAITCPSLIIAGDHDVILNKHTAAIANAITNSYLWIIPNTGHFTPVTRKDLFNTTVDAFFKTPYRKIEGMNRMFY